MDPGWRPAMEGLCSLVACELPLPADPESVALLNRDVRRHPQRGSEHTFYRMESPDWVNVIALDDAHQAELEALGEIAFIVVPSGMHRLDAGVRHTSRQQ